MRFRHSDGTVVHPAETLDGVLDQLRTFAAAVRERLGVPRLGVGLWLSRPVAAELLAEGVVRLKRELVSLGLEAVTLNGFPYEGFQNEEVKYRVYQPDWTTSDRLQYTLDLARILTRLLASDVGSGSISTLPLAWRHPYGAVQEEAVARKLDLLGRELATLAAQSGRTIRVAFEPEPGCIVETVTQAVERLPVHPFLGVCLDACHMAVQSEDPASAVAALGAAGLPVVKVQASCALEAPAFAQEALEAYVEPRFLHQTRGGGRGVDDLPVEAPWRTHFHIPLHAAPAAPLTSTQGVLRETLEALFGGSAR